MSDRGEKITEEQLRSFNKRLDKVSRELQKTSENQQQIMEELRRINDALGFYIDSLIGAIIREYGVNPDKLVGVLDDKLLSLREIVFNGLKNHKSRDEIWEEVRSNIINILNKEKRK